MLSFTLTTSSSFPPEDFFVLDALAEEPLLFMFFISMRLLKPFLAVATVAAEPFFTGSVSILAWRRALLAARAEAAAEEMLRVELGLDEEASETEGDGGNSFSREKVTERVFFLSPSLPLEVWRGIDSWVLWDPCFPCARIQGVRLVHGKG